MFVVSMGFKQGLRYQLNFVFVFVYKFYDILKIKMNSIFGDFQTDLGLFILED